MNDPDPPRSRPPSGAERLSSPESSRTGSGKGERRVRRSKRMRKRKPETKRFGFWIAVVLGLVVAAFGTYIFVVFPAGDGPHAGREVELTFERDEPVADVVKKLADAGLLQSPRVFGVYARLARLHVAPGRHYLSDEAGPGELVRRLERLGGAARGKVVVPEGFTRFDIARRLQTQGVCSSSAFLEATTDALLLRELSVEGDTVEGMLFPATYDLPKDSDARDVVRRMKTEFERRFLQLEQNHRLGRSNLESTLGWTRRDIITLASMVEREAAVDEERPIIASVFLNRLRDPAFKRKVLQCDPTAGYGCLVLGDAVPSCVGYQGKITHAVNFDPLNRYSTYVHEGLPPGPIANPGVKSLQAVLSPASTKYLYFVARGEGRRHTFSETVEDHNAAVKDLRERKSGDH